MGFFPSFFGALFSFMFFLHQACSEGVIGSGVGGMIHSTNRDGNGTKGHSNGKGCNQGGEKSHRESLSVAGWSIEHLRRGDR